MPVNLLKQIYNGLNQPHLNSVTVEAAGGKAFPCIVDVRDEQQVSNAVEQAVKKFGGKYTFTVKKLTAELPVNNSLTVYQVIVKCMAFRNWLP